MEIGRKRRPPSPDSISSTTDPGASAQPATVARATSARRSAKLDANTIGRSWLKWQDSPMARSKNGSPKLRRIARDLFRP